MLDYGTSLPIPEAHHTCGYFSMMPLFQYNAIILFPISIILSYIVHNKQRLCLARYGIPYLLVATKPILTRMQQITSHLTRLLARWPQDVLRPENNFPNVIRQRIQDPPIPFRDEDKEINAAYLLLDNTFTKQYPLPKSLVEPASNPTHYTQLKQELEEVPNRTWLGNWMKRLKHMVRFK